MKKDFKNKISAAACALLSVSSHSYAADQFDTNTQIDSSLMFYSEKDRVNTSSAQFNVNKTFTQDDVASLSLTYDSITGATPTGEIPYGSIQTVTSASGVTSTVNASTKPKLNISDARTAIAGSWQHQLTRLFSLSASLNASKESDYDSKDVFLNASLDSSDKLTTWSLSLAHNNDTIKRNSGVDGVAGVPLEMSDTRLLQRQSQQEKRSTQDKSLGLTQVLTANTLLQLSLSESDSSGYHSDPYKLISVVDSNGVQISSYYEKRPQSRKRNTFFAGLIHNTQSNNVMRLDYRFYRDDWGINSNTLDLKYRFNHHHSFFEPHLRLYQQTAADFHRYYLNTSDTVPDVASADARLDAFNSYTIGIGAGFTQHQYKFSGRLEYMSQSASSNNQNVPIKLRNYNLFYGVDAVIAQVNFSMTF